MLKERKNLPNSRVKLTIVADAAQFRHAFEHEIEEAAPTVKITGFRPGKAPKAKLIEHIGRQRLEAGAIDHAISHAYYDVVTAERLVPVNAPQVEVTEYVAPTDDTKDDAVTVTFTAEVDVLPEVKVDGYEKIKLAKGEPAPASDEDVQKILTHLRKQHGLLKELPEDRAAETDMWVDISYEGSVDGVKRADMKNEHHPVVIGEGALIPGFEDNIVGLKKGEEKTFTVTFPKDYHAKELAGKKAEFTVKVLELKEVVLPELDRDFAQQFGHDTMDALDKAIRESLGEEKAAEFKQKQEEEILEQLLKIAKLEVPQSLVEQEMGRQFEDGRKRLSQLPGQWEMYLEQSGKTADELREDLRPQAERSVRTGLVLGRIVELEKIPQSDKAGREALDRLLELAEKNSSKK